MLKPIKTILALSLIPILSFAWCSSNAAEMFGSQGENNLSEQDQGYSLTNQEGVLRLAINPLHQNEETPWSKLQAKIANPTIKNRVIEIYSDKVDPAQIAFLLRSIPSYNLGNLSILLLGEQSALLENAIQNTIMHKRIKSLTIATKKGNISPRFLTGIVNGVRLLSGEGRHFGSVIIESGLNTKNPSTDSVMSTIVGYAKTGAIGAVAAKIRDKSGARHLFGSYATSIGSYYAAGADLNKAAFTEALSQANLFGQESRWAGLELKHREMMQNNQGSDQRDFLQDRASGKAASQLQFGYQSSERVRELRKNQNQTPDFNSKWQNH
jgi:hypothetical protein